jgi:hypothetical protein
MQNAGTPQGRSSRGRSGKLQKSAAGHRTIDINWHYYSPNMFA